MQKELAMFGNLSQFPLGGKLSFKMMAFNVSSFFFFSHSTNQKKSPLKRYCAVQDLPETLDCKRFVVNQIFNNSSF